MELKIYMVCIDRNYYPVEGSRIKLNSPHFISFEEEVEVDDNTEDGHIIMSTPWRYCGSVEAFQNMRPTLNVPPLNWCFRKLTSFGEPDMEEWCLGCEPDGEWLEQRPLIICEPIDDTEARVEYVFIPEHLKYKLGNNNK